VQDFGYPRGHINEIRHSQPDKICVKDESSMGFRVVELKAGKEGMRHLLNRGRLMHGYPCGLDPALKKVQSVKKEHRGLAVGGGALARQAPGPGRWSMPDANTAFVKFCDIQKSCDDKVLLVKNLSLDIARGEFLTMLGPSGSGKTTTLMTLTGFEVRPKAPSFWRGARSTTCPAHKRDIGMVFAMSHALFPHMAVEENLAFPLKVRKLGKAEIEARIKWELDMVRLGAHGKRRPGQLSGGQQRVALAGALVFDLKLVFMDEPLGVLDKHLREQMRLEIKRVHEDLGVTVVYVMHDQSEARVVKHRYAVPHGHPVGRSPAELYERSQSVFIAKSLGENSPLHGKVVALNGATCKVKISGAGDVRDGVCRSGGAAKPCKYVGT